jgi:hypothetical protein
MTMPYEYYNPDSKLGFGDKRGIARDGAMVLGQGKKMNFTLTQGVQNTFMNLLRFNEYLFGWRFSLFLPLSFLVLARKTWFDWAMGTAVCSVILLYTAFWSKGFNFAGPIYYTDLIPLMCIAGSGFVYYLVNRWKNTKVSIALLSAFAVLFGYTLGVFVPETWIRLHHFTSSQSKALRKLKICEHGNPIVFTPYVTEIVDRYPHMVAENPPRVLYATHVSEQHDKKLMRFYPGRKGVFQGTDGHFSNFLDPIPEDYTCFPGEDYGDRENIVNDPSAFSGKSLRIPESGSSGTMWQRREPGNYVISVRARSDNAVDDVVSCKIVIRDLKENILINETVHIGNMHQQYEVSLALKELSVASIHIQNTGVHTMFLDQVCITVKE